MKPIPVCKVACATCPFNEGSALAHLTPTLIESALSEASRICHSTGSNNAIHRRTGKPAAICRGARDVQLRFFASIGFIDAPTDEAWAGKLEQLVEAKRSSKSKPKRSRI